MGSLEANEYRKIIIYPRTICQISGIQVLSPDQHYSILQDEVAPLPQAEPSPNPSGSGTGSSAVAATAATGSALPSPGILTTAATSTSSAAAATGQDAAGGSGTTGTSEKSAATVSFSSVVDQIPAASSSGFSSVTPVPASVKNRRRTSSVTKSRDRNLSEASQHSQESSRLISRHKNVFYFYFHLFSIHSHVFWGRG